MFKIVFRLICLCFLNKFINLKIDSISPKLYTYLPVYQIVYLENRWFYKTITTDKIDCLFNGEYYIIIFIAD